MTAASSSTPSTSATGTAPNVYDSLHNGGVTAINATIAVWENYRECMDNLVGWLHRFERDDRLVQAKSVRDILSAKEEGKVAWCSAGRTPRPSKTTSTALPCSTPWACA